LALGLGPIERKSALNEPFEARIELLGAGAEEIDSLRINLADEEQFRRAGVERSYVLTFLRFEVVQTPRGNDYIRITTKDPIKEPFLNFIIELNWSKGRLFRE